MIYMDISKGVRVLNNFFSSGEVFSFSSQFMERSGVHGTVGSSWNGREFMERSGVHGTVGSSWNGREFKIISFAPQKKFLGCVALMGVTPSLSL
jgi:hypothetical protein